MIKNNNTGIIKVETIFFSVTFNGRTTYPPGYNGTRKTTKNSGILKLLAAPQVTTVLSG